MPIVFAKPILPVTWDSEIAIDNPKFWAKLNELSGTSAADSGFAGLSGSYVNSPTLGQSPLINQNTAVVFDGSTQYATFAVSSNQFADNTFTMECWVNPTDISNSPTIIHVGDNSAGGTGIGFNLIIQPDGSLIFTTYSGGFVNASTSGGLIVNGVTSHVAVKIDSSTSVRFYIDGAFEEQVNVGWGSIGLHGTNPLKLGTLKQTGFTNFFAGKMDEFVLYDYLLDDARITAHYNAGV